MLRPVGRSERRWSSGSSLAVSEGKDFHRWQNIAGQTHSGLLNACWSWSGTGPAGRRSGEKFGYLKEEIGAGLDPEDSP